MLLVLVTKAVHFIIIFFVSHILKKNYLWTQSFIHHKKFSLGKEISESVDMYCVYDILNRTPTVNNYNLVLKTSSG